MTISPMACASIDRIFEQALREYCVIDPGEQCTVIPRDAPAVAVDRVGVKRVAACNISAYGFRIVIIYEFTDDAVTSAFLRRKFRMSGTESGNGFPVDACAEFINMSVGALKGGLTPAVPILGMSTPFFLETRGRQHMNALQPAYSRSLGIMTSDGCRFEVSYYVCVGRKSSVDFSIDTRSRELEPAGELELF